jgi:hypothetical protein
MPTSMPVIASKKRTRYLAPLPPKDKILRPILLGKRIALLVGVRRKEDMVLGKNSVSLAARRHYRERYERRSGGQLTDLLFSRWHLSRSIKYVLTISTGN